MRTLYVDFEYIESLNKTKFDLICCVIFDYKSNEIFRFDLRQNNDSLIDFLYELDLGQVLFYGYNISTAEVPCLCQIIGKEYVAQMQWVDLWTEFKMFALTHPKYYTEKTGLAGAIKLLDIQDMYAADKDKIRDLILSRGYKADEPKIKKFNYTDEQFKAIMFYCEQDVVILPEVAIKLSRMSREYPIRHKHRVKRGEHCKYAGIAYYYKKGFPMDVNKLRVIFDNIPRIKVLLQEQCNEETGFDIYTPEYKGPVKNKVFVKNKFTAKNFEEYLHNKGLLDSWARTEKGHLKLDEEYLDEMCSQYKTIIEPIYNARNTIKQLNSTNLADLLTPDGYIKGVSFPFNQKSSRSSPKPKLGFVLNLTPWLRMLIHPAPGRAFVSIDFKSQEVLIAAKLSGDDSMLEDYKGDIYIGQAIKTGFAPPDATKDTHKQLRNAFKPVALGRSYGMGPEKMAVHFFNMYKTLGQHKTLIECQWKAEEFIRNHKKAYYTYYGFLRYIFNLSHAQGYYMSLDHWMYFVDGKTRPTQLQNIPCQSNGAAMLRAAHDKCVAAGIYVDGLHDALSFECAEADAPRLAAIASKYMCEASRELLDDDSMQTETKIYTHECQYFDKRGEAVYRFIMQKLGLPCPDTFNKPAEIVNIHQNLKIVLGGS